MTSAFITGAASGIGAGCAQIFAGAGMTVVIADVDIEGAEQLASKLRDDGFEAFAQKLDVTSEEDWQTAASRAESNFGGIDWLINSAGVMGPMRTDLELVTTAQWRRVLSVNLEGTLLGLRTFIPSMKARGSGHIVNVGSIGSIHAGARNGPYTASKFAVAGLTRGLRAELEPFGIGVSLVCPGFVNTSLMETTAKNAPEIGSAFERSDMSDVTAMLKQGMAPVDAARIILAGVLANRENIFTDPSDRSLIESPGERISADFDWLESLAPAVQ